ncbi:hypothetical protein [Francisella adeliensis]|nr:hypothetical protein [Francisella adeliensis]MBK2086436.1 hypothetical protein [Francisella adeliensis]MBK2097054.1 hypothetical protein [Francisella adeliensis]
MIETGRRKDLIEQNNKSIKLTLDLLADEVYINKQILKEVTGVNSS